MYTLDFFEHTYIIDYFIVCFERGDEEQPAPRRSREMRWLHNFADARPRAARVYVVTRHITTEWHMSQEGRNVIREG